MISKAAELLTRKENSLFDQRYIPLVPKFSFGNIQYKIKRLVESQMRRRNFKFRILWEARTQTAAVIIVETNLSSFFFLLSFFIRKTCPCNVYPLKPHFYIEKLGFAGICLFFLFLLQNIDCGYSLEPPRRGGSNEYPQSMFWSKNKKNIKNFQQKIFRS